jgi:hypothetical protein
MNVRRADKDKLYMISEFVEGGCVMPDAQYVGSVKLAGGRAIAALSLHVSLHGSLVCL